MPRRGHGGSGGAIEAQTAAGAMLFGEFAPWALEVRRAHQGDAHHRNLCWCLMYLMPFIAEWPLV